jgi:hypothetical protein
LGSACSLAVENDIVASQRLQGRQPPAVI